MGQTVLKKVWTNLLQSSPELPAQSKTAQAIDGRSVREDRVQAIDEGYVEFVDQFSKFMRSVCRST